jgi:hypothetical protein
MQTWSSRKRWYTARMRTAANTTGDHDGPAPDGLRSRGRRTRRSGCERRACRTRARLDSLVGSYHRLILPPEPVRYTIKRADFGVAPDHFLGGVHAPSSVRGP